MNTQESNKMIAEFMQFIEDGLYLDGLYFYEGRYYDTNMEFHKSWDWLMPVVEKIEEHGYDFIATKRRATRTYDANFMDEVNNYVVYVEDCKDRQEATYKAVVEFINQYNKNK